jgi:predicted dienelactone hydrolase
MKSFKNLLTVLFIVTSSTTVLAAETVGVRTMSVASPERGKDLDVTVWYPSQADGLPATIGDNRIFVGEPALRDASLQKGRFPLVLLSHGSGSRVEGMTWIATHLAKAGFIVAGPNHPGTTSGYSTPEATPKIWERTQDFSNMISAFEKDHLWSASIDMGHIGILGFSLGGTTAMELAGARAELEPYAQYCEGHADMMDCKWFAGGRGYVDEIAVDVEKLDLRTIDKGRFEQSNWDPRIVSVVAVDPGLASVFTPQSLKDISIPLTILNLGDVGKIPFAVLSDELALRVPGAGYKQVDGSDHFSFLPVCKQGAADFLISVGEHDPICSDAGLRNRAEVHEELEKLITDAFKQTLKSGI